MRIDRFLGTMGPLFALSALGALSGCNGIWSGLADGDGVPLAELDLAAGPPEGVVLAGPDTVTITSGEQFTVAAEGQAADKLRFKLENGTLTITRERNDWSGEGDGNGNGAATVRITMPAPRRLSMAGSGHMTSEALASKADLSIAGSGTLETPNVAARSLAVSIAGSGVYRAGGQADTLELSLAGSGDGDMTGLKVARATISIAGSGDAAFASDGEVEASIMGSGTVTVHGSARCKITAIGSGSLICERAAA
jgi:hypothetical protein